MTRRWLIGLLSMTLFTGSMSAPAPAEAHLATFGSWETTRGYLQELFPKATTFLVKKHSYTPEQVAQVEKELGFKLYPEDKTPTFYIAVDDSSGKRRLLGVAIFIDPRVTPKVFGGAPIRLEVGIAVDTKGAIKKMRVFDYKGNLKLMGTEFLAQFEGMTLKSDFTIGKTVKAVEGEDEESQLIAHAGREALQLMKISLGKK